MCTQLHIARTMEHMILLEVLFCLQSAKMQLHLLIVSMVLLKVLRKFDISGFQVDRSTSTMLL